MKWSNLFTHGAPRNSQELVQKRPCRIELEFGNVVFFEGRGKPKFLGKNFSEKSREPTTISTHESEGILYPHMTPGPWIEPGTHCWEASALTTTPSMHVILRFIMLYRVVPTLKCVDEILVCDYSDKSVKATEQYFHVVLFIMFDVACVASVPVRSERNSGSAY